MDFTPLKTLEVAFERRDLYNLYVSLLVQGMKRFRELLKVFYEVRSGSVSSREALLSFIDDIGTFHQLCSRATLVLASHTIPGNRIQTGEYPAASGGFGDVWEGIHSDKLVAIKALRMRDTDCAKEVTKASFPNLVVSYGSSSRPTTRSSMRRLYGSHQ